MQPLSASLLLLLALNLHFFLFLPATTAASPSAAAPLSPNAACRTSVYPKLCRAVLAPLRFHANHYGFGRHCVKQALKQARRTSKILDHLLSPGGTARSRRIAGGAGAGALEDCRELARLNTEYLEEVRAELDRGESSLSSPKADRVRALMSAVVTNQQTCFDCLDAAVAAASWRGTTPRPSAELLAPFANASQLYCVSLELVTGALSGEGRIPGKPPLLGSTQHNQGFHIEAQHLAGGTQSRVLAGVRINGAVVVAKDGSGDFTTITEAVAFAPNNTDVEDAQDGYFKITIGEGVYEENVVVGKQKKNLILVGAGINRTVVTGSRSVVDGWTTFNSATFAVHGERFIAVNITFENTAGPEKHQAVAVRNSADLSTFYRCSFMGYQDTLYVHSLRQFYRDCDVYGTVDFIFGNAATVFQNCNIYARRPLASQVNAVTAQGRTHPNQTTGISIHNCTVGAAPDMEAEPNATQTYLGRPWKEYSRTVYMQSYFGELIQPEGWLEWNGSFALSTLYYGEFENSGPGANTSARVRWPGYSLMDAAEASNFTVYNFTRGDAWLLYTSIPHFGGLL